jgi:phosphopantothenoylcysteine decarboxylase/phosphopantothenate--cysteine ligase
MLTGKNIVIGVTGGIAAYKAVEVVSRLKKAGAIVHVVMTKAATEFVTPLTFREISGNPVITDMWAEPKKWHVEHIALASLADAFFVVPASANTIGKLANGIADNMLTTTIMATKAPVFLAPAMNSNMYENKIVQKNINNLRSLGYIVIEPDTGLMACGSSGPGRLPEPGVLVDRLADFFQPNTSETSWYAGKKVIVTAGGTREPIDPVRYIGNRSSGKMGYAIACAAAKRGAKVVLVSGPTNLPCPENVTIKKVESAKEMRQLVLAEYPDSDIVIKAAAVADYCVNEPSKQKIKKSDEQLTLTLQKNPDILRELGALKGRQILVGFAAETEELLVHAMEKLIKKNLDMIIANDVTLPGAGFNTDTNVIKILYRNGEKEEFPKLSKENLAEIILDKIYNWYQKMY